MKKVVAIVLSLMVLCFGSVYAGDFTDLPPEHWAYNDVMALVEEGVINGYKDGTYKPDQTITRGEFFKLISVAAVGEEGIEPLKFSFMTWAEPYAFWLYNEELMMDGKNIQNLDDPITREEMAIVLSKVAIKSKISDKYYDENNPVEEYIEFSDLTDLSQSSQVFIEYASFLGLIRGYADGTFKPQKAMTRAEVATVIYRFSTIK